MQTSPELKKRDLSLYAVIIGTFLFMINDITFFFIIDPFAWILTDYAFRILVLLALAAPILKKETDLRSLGFKRLDFAPLVLWTLVLTLLNAFPITYLMDILRNTYPGQSLIHFPEINNKFLKYFDLSFGLILVAFSEEVLFRGYYVVLLKKYLKSNAAVMIISSVCFGLIHWGLGWIDVIETSSWGLIVIYSVYRSGSIYPAILSHFFINFIFFF